LVDPDHSHNRSISDIEIPPEGRVVHLRQYGFIKVFRIVHADGETEHWATDILDALEQRVHILLSLIAFLRLESHRLNTFQLVRVETLDSSIGFFSFYLLTSFLI